MTLNTLISNVPDSQDIDAMSDWFSDVKVWADKNNQPHLSTDATNGLFFGSHPNRVTEYRRKILSQLKSFAKEQMDMEDKIKVFIVHGHNNELKSEVARYIEKLGFDAIIFHEQANGSRTIIEKLEQITADVQFAVVLYTGDDDGIDGKKRARQNVVFEHGYFVAHLGRNKTCAIMDNNVERPSDSDGIIYIPIDYWRMELAREMKNAGLPVDMNKI